MFTPKEEKLNHILQFLSKSENPNNEIQKSVYQEFLSYCKDDETPQYLIYILSSSYSSEIINMASIILKNIIETNIQLFSPLSIDYFKKTIMKCYNDKIGKNISNLIATFVHHFGIDAWPEILELLANQIDAKSYNEIALKTLDIILEDTQNTFEDRVYTSSIAERILISLKELKDNSLIPGAKEDDQNEIVTTLLNTLSIFMECCQETTVEKMNDIVFILRQFIHSSDKDIKNKIGKCFYTAIHLDRSIIYNYYEELFVFFIEGLSECNTNLANGSLKKEENCFENQLSFISSEFFLFIISSNHSEEILKNDVIKNCLRNNLSLILPKVVTNMKLTQVDIDGFDSKFQAESSNMTQMETLSMEEETLISASETTLRKCCGRIVDTISIIFPNETFSIIRPILETDIQSSDETVKERSILALGAIANGAYQQVLPHLKTLIPFLIRELQHPNKYIRAIASWTLSRYTRYILNDNLSFNKEELFKEYLTEILKKFLDKENIVRESACTAFQEMITANKGLMEPYLSDIFKIISTVFDRFAGLNLLSVYDILIILMENFGSSFENQQLVDEIDKCIVQKWYDLVKNNDLMTLPMFFDVLTSLIQVSGDFLVIYCDYFFTGCMKIIEQNVNEMKSNNYLTRDVNKDLLTKALDCISVLCQNYPEYTKNAMNRMDIIDMLFEIMHVKDLYILHYVIALFGDIAKLDRMILEPKIDSLISMLVPLISLNVKIGESPNEKLSVCNNSVWVMGILAVVFSNRMSKYIDKAMEKICEILKMQKINKALVQNLSICIGRFALVNAETISKYLDKFIKSFCLSLRNVNDSAEKRDAFQGLCGAITFNPRGIMEYFVFFCDAICLFENPPEYLEKIFQEIMLSYTTSFGDSFKEEVDSFPVNLKEKMVLRFRIKL